ncbi:hypothetical protein L195_g052162, partial [Trifolium pratense]
MRSDQRKETYSRAHQGFQNQNQDHRDRKKQHEMQVYRKRKMRCKRIYERCRRKRELREESMQWRYMELLDSSKFIASASDCELPRREESVRSNMDMVVVVVVVDG